MTPSLSNTFQTASPYPSYGAPNPGQKPKAATSQASLNLGQSLKANPGDTIAFQGKLFGGGKSEKNTFQPQGPTAKPSLWQRMKGGVKGAWELSKRSFLSNVLWTAAFTAVTSIFHIATMGVSAVGTVLTLLPTMMLFSAAYGFILGARDPHAFGVR